MFSALSVNYAGRTVEIKSDTDTIAKVMVGASGPVVCKEVHALDTGASLSVSTPDTLEVGTEEIHVYVVAYEEFG